MNRILWNDRDGNDIDEIVAEGVDVHIEQMNARCWWIQIDFDGGAGWAGNFHCNSRGRMSFSEQEAWGRMSFSEQEAWGFNWDRDQEHGTVT